MTLKQWNTPLKKRCYLVEIECYSNQEPIWDKRALKEFIETVGFHHISNKRVIKITQKSITKKKREAVVTV